MADWPRGSSSAWPTRSSTATTPAADGESQGAALPLAALRQFGSTGALPARRSSPSWTQPRLDYVVAMAKNAVLERYAEPAMLVARARTWRSEQTEHVYTETVPGRARIETRGDPPTARSVTATTSARQSPWKCTGQAFPRVCLKALSSSNQARVVMGVALFLADRRFQWRAACSPAARDTRPAEAIEPLGRDSLHVGCPWRVVPD